MPKTQKFDRIKEIIEIPDPGYFRPANTHGREKFRDGKLYVMKLNTVFFIGPQGSGKGTQAKLLAGKLNFFHWDMGAILREVAKTDNDLGKKIKALIESGILLKDDDLYEVVRFRLNQISAGQGVIFDGIPRRLGQAEFLMEFLQKQGRTNFVTLFVNLPRKECLKRLALRAQKEGRADDTPEKIEYRLRQYEQDTLPVLDYLKSQTMFIEVDGEPAIGEVTKKINEALGLT